MAKKTRKRLLSALVLFLSAGIFEAGIAIQFYLLNFSSVSIEFVLYAFSSVLSFVGVGLFANAYKLQGQIDAVENSKQHH